MSDSDATIEELLGVIEELLPFLRPWTFDEREGEVDAYERAKALLDRYRPASSGGSA